ncbi:MAG: cytochrome c family protein [Gammaproteobacteria bacterium]|nr:cytochrome c family protein [Gammaproteobacteria bacterium]
MKTPVKIIAWVLTVPMAVVLGVSLYFGVHMLVRQQPEVRSGTVHSSLSRESCDGCHAPIASEWRESYHFRSLTGPFWARIRAKGYERLFASLRIACVNCHAPANVLDLARGAYPVQRSDGVARGVDCVSCHVSKRGIHGPGRSTTTAHEVIADQRFRDPMVASVAVCGTCHEEAKHANTVSAWRQTDFAENGVSCLHCHMPEIRVPSVVDGPARTRRSHRFLGDKNEEMLKKALNASVVTTTDGKAMVRLVNDRVGHSFPAAGMNSLVVNVTVHDQEGRVVQVVHREFGTKERLPEYLDFWPFLRVSKIPYGASREITIRLPPGPGFVTADFLYRDWVTITDRDTLIERITKRY